MTDDKFLEHFGVPGMKWGRRKTTSTKAPSTKKTTKAKPKTKPKTKPKKRLSDEQLRKKLTRLQMEKQYKQLTKKDRSVGSKIVTDIFTNAAKQTATAYVSKYMTKGLESVLDRATS